MKFEGIEIALEGIWYKDNLLAQFQFLRISYSLKASAEERGYLPGTENDQCPICAISHLMNVH